MAFGKERFEFFGFDVLQRLQFENNGVRTLPFESKRIIEVIQRQFIQPISALGVCAVARVGCCGGPCNT